MVVILYGVYNSYIDSWWVFICTHLLLAPINCHTRLAGSPHSLLWCHPKTNKTHKL